MQFFACLLFDADSGDGTQSLGETGEVRMGVCKTLFGVLIVGLLFAVGMMLWEINNRLDKFW